MEATMNTVTSMELAKRIREWVKNNDWYGVNIQTNQLRLEQSFGQIIELIAKDLEYQNQYKMRRQVFDCYDHLMAKCRQIDVICRTGCRSEAEMLELEFLRGKAVGAAAELAEVLSLMKDQSETLCAKSKTDINSQNHTIPNSNSANCFISFAEAAEILCVSKSTVSNWVDKGKVRDNGQRGQKRRVLQSDILIIKHERETMEILKDARELKADALEISRRH